MPGECACRGKCPDIQARIPSLPVTFSLENSLVVLAKVLKFIVVSLMTFVCSVAAIFSYPAAIAIIPVYCLT